MPDPLLHGDARRPSMLADIVTVDAFTERAERVEWFASLGQPSRWDSCCERIESFDHWPGPEAPEILALALHNSDIYDAFFAGMTDEVPTRVYGDLHLLVLTKAAERVAFDPDEDAWHGPTQCVWDAARLAGLIASHIAASAPLHPDIDQQWSWYEDGHWPTGLSGVNAQRLIVL